MSGLDRTHRLPLGLAAGEAVDAAGVVVEARDEIRRLDSGQSDDWIADTRTPWILEVVDAYSRPDDVPVWMATNWWIEAVGNWLKM